MTITKQQKKNTDQQELNRLDGVVIGILVGINDKGEPLVIHPANTSDIAIKANTTSSLCSDDIGKEVALLFQGGDPQYPIIIGRIQNPQVVDKVPDNPVIEAENFSENIANLDGEHINLMGKESITLKCGRASITLTKSGKILVRGSYILNRSSGVNRIKGGSVQIN
ncbi:DUF6484 domain-containing protein [Cocleimonas flava]|uniref:DUF6484 domain-containing protein n=1 Tax=Cocleimonas flava TaxID=634765 RepID=A0A4R1F256_9GAMM|nr:DUF6484 domain-containing protein [Cocleimonas flava]TCJ87490.1 hypothetical protein EV695_2000 [Cocleimonas flava]